MLNDAIQFDRDEREAHRVRALEYLRGIMNDTPAEAGRSKMTTSELGDAVGWLMPGLMRIFAGSANVVEYQPTRPGTETQAQQASDYVSHIFMNECDGYKVLFHAIYDALAVRNGVIKYWWEDEAKGKTELLASLSEQQIALLQQDHNVKILGAVEGDDPGTFTIKAQHIEKQGSLKVTAIPPEEFLISRRARDMDTAPLVGHRGFCTRSDLIADGYDREAVENLPIANHTDNEITDLSRGRLDTQPHTAYEQAMEVIEKFECYVRHDIDGDGVAEMCQVIAAGSQSSPTILSLEEWADEDAPFADFVAGIVPHSWQGRSVSDDVMDVQRVNTVLLRQALDNIYLSNRPQRAVDARQIENPDEVLNPTIGGTIRVKGDPRAAIVDLALPFTAQASFDAMRYFQQILQARTGVNQATTVMDEGALVPETATGEQIQHDAGFARQELIARNIAEGGMKRMFRALLRLVVRHQDRARTIRMSGKWVDFDPRAWDAEMEVNVNVGLGTGTRERDLKMLGTIAVQQEKIIAQLGPENPVVPPSKYVGTLHKMVTATGLKDPDNYFADVNDQQFAQWKAQQPPPPPNPKDVAAVQKSQADIQAKQAKTQAEIQLGQQKMQTDAELKKYELEQEAQLKALEIASGHINAQATNIRAVTHDG